MLKSKKIKLPEQKLAWNLVLCRYDNKEFIIKAHDLSNAVEIFVKRYGYPPEQAFLVCGISENVEFII